MKRCMLLLVVLSVWTGMTHAETLTFENLYSNDGAPYNVGVYHGLTFYYMESFDSVTYPNPLNDSAVYVAGSYYPFEPASYPYASVLDENGNTIYPEQYAQFYSSTGTFTLNSMEAVALGGSDEWILGYRDGVLEDEATTDQAVGPNDLLTLNWTGIDAVLFVGGLEDGNVAIDNVTINEPVTGETPEPLSVILVGSGALGLAGSLRRRLRNGMGRA